MYLVDTDVLSEMRKGAKAAAGVRQFLRQAQESDSGLYISVITIGELRRGIELLRHRKDSTQATLLEQWLSLLLTEYGEHILDFGLDEAQVWGQLRVPKPENPLDKQIAAIALTHGLTLVTRNISHFEALGVDLLNPFT